MLALTLKQPWAWMVLRGTKDMENRPWTNVRVQELIDSRQPFAIHTGRKPTQRYYAEARLFALSVDPAMVVPEFGELDFNAVLGTARILRTRSPQAWKPGRWHMQGQWGWELYDRTPFERPVPWHGGRLGFWALDPELLLSKVMPNERRRVP